MVFIKVFDISEAFQMFDSQNGTGMPLEPYNLLKAFHLKSIKSDIVLISFKYSIVNFLNGKTKFFE